MSITEIEQSWAKYGRYIVNREIFTLVQVRDGQCVLSWLELLTKQILLSLVAGVEARASRHIAIQLDAKSAMVKVPVGNIPDIGAWLVSMRGTK